MNIYTKVFLILFGCITGCLLAGLAYYMLILRPQAATHFSSLEDFHKTLIERDSSDIKKDKSVSLRSIIQPNPSKEIMYELKPNLNTKFQGQELRTNPYGMRGKEIPIKRKSENIYRIALLGDSFTFGWGVKEEDSFGSIIENELNRMTNNCPSVEVLNFGVPGYSTFQETAIFTEKGVQFEPDAVLVFFVDNDYYLPFFIADIGSPGELLSSQSFSKRLWAKNNPAIMEQHDEMARFLDPNIRLAQLKKILDQKGTALYLAINPGNSYQKDRKKLWILKKRKKPKFIHLKKPFKNLIQERNIDVKDLTLSNDPHPSALKHQLMGEIIAANLIDELKNSQRSNNCQKR